MLETTALRWLPAVWLAFAAAPVAQDEPKPAAAAELSSRIDRFMAEQVADGGPGAAVLVIDRGTVLHKKGYGLANVENRVAITSRTAFDLASVGKQFTALAVLLLHEGKRLDLKDDVRRFIPELPVWDRKRPVRIADLLHHVTGIPDYLGLAEKYGKRDEEMTNADVAALLKDVKLEFPTGSKFSYSNSNYTLAALVIERVTGEPFGRFLRKRLFDPLGMDNSLLIDAATQVIPNRAYGYRRPEGGLRWVHSDLTTTGDGGVWSCLDDFEKWDAELRSPTLLAPATLELAFTPAALDRGGKTEYGFGWGIGKEGTEPIVEHSGGWVGFLAHHLRYRERGLTVVVLMNRDDPAVGPSAIAHRIGRWVLGQER